MDVKDIYPASSSTESGQLHVSCADVKGLYPTSTDSGPLFVSFERCDVINCSTDERVIGKLSAAWHIGVQLVAERIRDYCQTRYCCQSVKLCVWLGTQRQLYRDVWERGENILMGIFVAAYMCMCKYMHVQCVCVCVCARARTCVRAHMHIHCHLQCM